MSASADKIVITAVDPVGPSVTCLHGDGTASFSSQSGWQFTQRPRRSSFTEFMGYDPYTLTVPVMFGDATDTTLQIDPALEVLRGMARNMVGARQEPAVVTIDCPAIPLTWFQWVINDIKYSSEYRNNDGSRYFATLSLTFLQYIPTDLVATKAPASVASKVAATTKAQSASSLVTSGASSSTLDASGQLTIPNQAISNAAWPSSLTYKVKKGDTLETIATKLCGSPTLWTQIAALNGNIRDPKSITVGEVLRIPAINVAPSTLPVSVGFHK